MLTNKLSVLRGRAKQTLCVFFTFFIKILILDWGPYIVYFWSMCRSFKYFLFWFRIRLGPWIRIQRYKIKRKAEFNQKSCWGFFLRKLYVSSLKLKTLSLRFENNFFSLFYEMVWNRFGDYTDLDPDPHTIKADPYHCFKLWSFQNYFENAVALLRNRREQMYSLIRSV